MLKKLYFAINETGVPGYEDSIKATVLSAKKNTKLRLHCLYYGREVPFLNWLREQDVVILAKPSRLQTVISEAANNSSWNKETASGAYLRLSIPDVEEEEDYVLYTDCDVMFLPGFKADLPCPRYISCAPEHEQNENKFFNSGVMVMNVKALKTLQDELYNFVARGLTSFWRAGRGTYDQGALNAFFTGIWDRLPNEYNWKPYWGCNRNAMIVHFHGPKPAFIRKLIASDKDVPAVYQTLYRLNPQGCQFYMQEFEKVLRP